MAGLSGSMTIDIKEGTHHYTFYRHKGGDGFGSFFENRLKPVTRGLLERHILT